jgi:hypothetical protein
LLSDSSGNPINVTHDDIGTTVNALYVHPADASGNSLDSVGPQGAQTLAVSIRDSSNAAIDSTGDIQNLHIMDQDITKFPSTDILFLVSRGYRMGAHVPNVDNPRIRHALAFIRDFVQQISDHKSNYTDCRVTIATYGRLDISTNEPLNVTLTTGHESGEPSDRTMIPGSIEYTKSNAEIVPATIYNLVENLSLVGYNPPPDSCGNHHVHAIGVSGEGDAAPDFYESLVVPGNNIYTTVKNLFTASVGNIRDLRGEQFPASWPTSFEVLSTATKPVVIAFTDVSFGDYGDGGDGGDGVFTYADNENVQSAIFATAEHQLKENFSSDIYVVKIGDASDPATKNSLAAFTDPCGSVPNYDDILIANDNTRSDNARILELTTVDNIATGGVYSDATGLLFKTIYGTEFIGHNALKSVITDNTGIEQASTQAVSGAQFDGRALYYVLGDKDGVQYSTTKNDTCSNAMYVHLTDQNGKNISTSNRLSVRFQSQVQKALTPFETTVEASMTSLLDNSLQLHSLGIANELPITVWLKVYDTCSTLVTDTTDFTSNISNVKYNLPVPPSDYRDLHLSSGVKFNKGMYFRISQDYGYDNSYVGLGPESGQVYVTGTYS